MKPTTNIGIIILAAGASKRMGQPKQLLQFKGETLIQKIIKIALETDCRPIVVVLGAFLNEVSLEIRKLGNYETEQSEIYLVENQRWQQGMSTSIKMGLETLLSVNPTIEAALFLLTDQPLLTTEHLLRLMPDARCQTSDATITASFYNDRLGVPALFPKKWFPELMQLTGDEGARKLLELYKNEIHTIPFPEGALDLDTPDDYLNLLKYGLLNFKL